MTQSVSYRGMRKAIVTAAGPNMLPVLTQFSLPSFELFAKHHGYTVQVMHLKEDDTERKSEKAKRARWQKLTAIRAALLQNEVVVWFDADVLVCRTDIDILDSLSPTDYQGFVLHSVPSENRINPNTGVWVIRHTEKAFRFLDVLDAIGMPEGRWSDQGAVLEALGWIKGDKRYHGARMPAIPNEFIEGTAWLPIGWNQPYCVNRPNTEDYVNRPTVSDPFAIHFMAMTIDERLKCMGTVINRNCSFHQTNRRYS